LGTDAYKELLEIKEIIDGELASWTNRRKWWKY
jgi:hypothetical protein